MTISTAIRNKLPGELIWPNRYSWEIFFKLAEFLFYWVGWRHWKSKRILESGACTWTYKPYGVALLLCRLLENALEVSKTFFDFGRNYFRLNETERIKVKKFFSQLGRNRWPHQNDVIVAVKRKNIVHCSTVAAVALPLGGHSQIGHRHQSVRGTLGRSRPHWQVQTSAGAEKVRFAFLFFRRPAYGVVPTKQ